jgi:hypothetical protein
MNTKTYLQNAVDELEKNMDWTSGVVFGLQEHADKYEIDSEEYIKTMNQIEKLYVIQEKSVRARMNLLNAMELLEEEQE